MTYYQFATDSDDMFPGEPYGSCEVFYMDACLACDYGKVSLAAGGPPADYEAGWYWQACFPGCMPDGDPCGPFETEQEAMDDANVYQEAG